jgi:hypothetical protein
LGKPRRTLVKLALAASLMVDSRFAVEKARPDRADSRVTWSILISPETMSSTSFLAAAKAAYESGDL